MKKHYDNFKKVSIAFMLLFCILLLQKVNAQSHNVDSAVVIMDSYISSNNMDANYGGNAELRIKPTSSDLNYVYLKFDLTGIPVPDSVTLSVYGAQYNKNSSVYADFNVQLYSVGSEDWEENSITWSNKPDAGSQLATMNFVSQEGGWMNFTDQLVSDLVINAISNSQSTFSFLLKSNQSDIEGDDYAWMGGREWRGSWLKFFYKADENIIPVKFSHESGLFTENFDLNMYTIDGNSIYYTTDGTFPTKDASLYTSPVSIDTSTMIRAVSAKMEEDEVTYSYLSEVNLNIGVLIPFNDSPMPIPGRVEAEDYDFANEAGIASHDEDITTDRCVENSGCSSTNPDDPFRQCLSEYRYGKNDNCIYNYPDDYLIVSDGHDGSCGTCSDGTQACDIGYVTDGEWWRYTVDVKKTGLFNLSGRYRSQSSDTRIPGCRIETLKDGKTTFVGRYRFTGGDSWECLDAVEGSIGQNLFLTKGIQTIKIEVLNEHPDSSYNFNPDYFQFTDGADLVSVQSIELSDNEKAIEQSEIFQLSAALLPDDATVSSFIWSSSDPAVAFVDQEGYVYGLSDGEALITVTSVENDQVTATCEVKVGENIGVAQPSSLLSFKVYPTLMAKGMSQLHISFAMTSDATVSFVLCDIYGRTVNAFDYRAKAGGNFTSMHLNRNLSGGLYILQLYSDRRIIEKTKIIVQ